MTPPAAPAAIAVPAEAARPVKASRFVFDRHSLDFMRRLFVDWVWPRRATLIVNLLLTAALALCTGAYPLIIQQSFDMLKDGRAERLPLVIGAIIAATTGRSLFLYLQTVASNRIALRMTTDMQERAFGQLIGADLARIARESPGRLMSRLTNDIGFIQGAVQATLSTAIRDVLSIVVLVATMIHLDWAMTAFVLLVYPVAALPIAIISERLRRNAKRTQTGLGDMTSLLGEKLSGMRLIKTFGLEGYAVARVTASFEDLFSLRMKGVRNRARIDPMLEALGGLAIAGVVAFAYWRIAAGQSTVGDFMGFVTALLMASQPIRALGNLPGRIQEGLAAVESFYGILDEVPKVVDLPGAKNLGTVGGAIRFDKVSFAYDGRDDLPALHDLTFDVAPGSTVALVGRSGAGKSTVINLVPRLFDVTAGAIYVDGVDVREATLDSLRGALAIVAQDVTLFDDTIRANIALGRLGATDTEIMAAAEAAAAHEFIMAQPKGYDTEIGDRGLRLSGGQRQRLALARAILKDAPILLLDEATSALDSESERLVQDALARFTKNRTTLVVAHRLATIQHADLICVMEDGRIIEQGRHADLIGYEGAYARLVRAQALGEEGSG